MSTETARRVAVVTGGGRGIGRGIALELARRGYALVINYRSGAAQARAVCAEAEALGAPAALAVAADLADLEAGRLLVEAATERLGRLDVWVSNAGIAPRVRADLLETSPESFDEVMGVNLRGAFFAAQAAARAQIQQVRDRPNEPPPRMILVTSVSSTLASVNRGEYCVSKAGLSMVARLFAVRLAEHGIAVFEVRPGVIATDMTAGVRAAYDQRLADGLAPIRRWGTPEDVGRMVGLLSDDGPTYATGQVFDVDGGLSLPRL